MTQMTKMTAARKSLDEYMALQYPFQVIADPDGGYVIMFPDLPGCMTQAETMDEIPVMAEDARRAWVSVAYADGDDIPLPSYPEEYSGKFNVRLPRSLHRALAEGAKRNGISLNQYVETVLARGESQDRIERRLEQLEDSFCRRLESLSDQVGHIDRRLRFPVTTRDIGVKESPARAVYREAAGWTATSGQAVSEANDRVRLYASVGRAV